MKNKIVAIVIAVVLITFIVVSLILFLNTNPKNYLVIIIGAIYGVVILHGIIIPTVYVFYTNDITDEIISKD